MSADLGFIDPPATFVGTDEQLCNALRYVASKQRHPMTVRAVAEAAAERLEAALAKIAQEG